jgi:hypothetical protein
MIASPTISSDAGDKIPGAPPHRKAEPDGGLACTMGSFRCLSMLMRYLHLGAQHSTEGDVADPRQGKHPPRSDREYSSARVTLDRQNHLISRLEIAIFDGTSTR